MKMVRKDDPAQIDSLIEQTTKTVRELPLSHSHTLLTKTGEPMKTSISSALKTTLKATACAALLASASSAFAQSSVQLYGQVDEWVGSQKFPGGKTAVGGSRG